MLLLVVGLGATRAISQSVTTSQPTLSKNAAVKADPKVDLSRPTALVSIHTYTGTTPDKTTDPAVVKAAMIMLKTEKVLQRALDNPNVHATKWYEQNAYVNRNLPGLLKKQLRAQIIPGTNLIAVSFRSSGPKENVMITNKIIQAFYDEMKEGSCSDISERITLLLRERDYLNTEIAKLQELIVKLTTPSDGKLTLETLKTKMNLLQPMLLNARLAYLLALENAKDQKKADAKKLNPKNVAQAKTKYDLLKKIEGEINVEIKQTATRKIRRNAFAAARNSFLKRVNVIDDQILELRLEMRGNSPVTILRPALRP